MSESYIDKLKRAAVHLTSLALGGRYDPVSHTDHSKLSERGKHQQLRLAANTLDNLL